MADVFSKLKRSEVMSRIRSEGNRDTEVALAKLFRKQGVTGWRRNQKIFGKPDFLFRQERLAVFVDGCFWHGCSKHGTQPKGNRSFWKRKLACNKARDLLVNQKLRESGWRGLRIWQHELKRKNEPRLLRKIHRALATACSIA